MVPRNPLGLSLLAILATSCSGTAGPSSSAHVVPPPPISDAPVPLQPTPTWIAEECATVALLRPVCPTTLPRGNGSTTAFIETFRRRPAVFSVESGGQRYGDPAWNRPPRYFHVTVRARRLVPGREAAWLRPPLPRYRAGDAVGADTGRAELVGRPRWFGASRPLILTAARDLAVRWRVGSVGYEMALHVWAPFRETAPTLAALLGRTLALPPAAVPAPPVEAPSSGGIAWVPTPAWILTACKAMPGLNGLCPRTIPLARSGYILASYERRLPTCGGGRRDVLSLEWGGEDPSHPRRNRPPGFLHLEVAGGSGCLRSRFPGSIAAPRAGVMRGRSFLAARRVPFGRRTWGGHDGVLVLGDCFGNHLCFRWREAGSVYQIDLHGWEPFPEAVAALRRIVSSSQ
jgi:hypothetical protein